MRDLRARDRPTSSRSRTGCTTSASDRREGVADDRRRHHPRRRLVLASRRSSCLVAAGHPDHHAQGRSSGATIRTYEPALVIGGRSASRASAFFLGEAVEHRHRPRARTDAMAHMIAVDGFSVFVGTVVLIVDALLTLLLSCDYLVRRGIESRPEYVALLLFSVAGMLVMTDGERPHRGVRGARGAVDPALRARRVRPQPAPARSRPASSTSCSARSPRRSSSTASRSSTAPPGPPRSSGIADVPRHPRARRRGHAARRDGAPARRARLQDRRGAVPHVDARRLRGRADARSPGSWPRPPRPPASPRCSGCCSPALGAVPDRLAQPAIWALAVLTLLGGSIVALRQTDLKRMLAYSSIATPGTCSSASQAGHRAQGLQAALVYLLVYSFMTIGVVRDRDRARRPRRPHSHRATYRALATGANRCSPALLAFFLLAQAGIPPTGGFIAKLGVFGRRRADGALVRPADRRRGHLGDHRVLLPAGDPHDVRRPRTSRPSPTSVEVEPPADRLGLPDRDRAHDLRAALTIWIGILPTRDPRLRASDATLII